MMYLDKQGNNLAFSRQDKRMLLLLSIIVFINNYSYFTWNSFSSYANVVKFIPYLAVLIFIFYCFLNYYRLLRYTRRSLKIMALSIALIIHINFLGTEYNNTLSIGDVLLFAVIFILIGLKIEYKALLFRDIVILFSVLCIPGLIYYLLSIIGIQYPHGIIESSHEVKKYVLQYLHYPLGLLAQDIQTGTLRYCAIFDEPGVVGTIAGLLFSASYNKINKKWSIILLIEGIMSLSIAFILIIVIHFIVHFFLKKKFKFFVLLLGLFIVFFVLTNVPLDNTPFAYIQNRIDLTSKFLFADNRTDAAFDAEFDRFIHEGGCSLFFGYGFEAANQQAAITTSFSYKMLIYDYGIMGFCMYLFFFIQNCFGSISRDTLPFIVVFFCSIYQRPYVFNTQFIMIFICGLAFICVSNDKQKETKYNVIDYQSN